MQQLLLDISPPPSPTLANFLQGHNAELLQLLRQVLAGQEQERFVYVWGGPGCGKTHLLRAMIEGHIQQKLKTAYVTSDAHSDATIDVEIDCVAVDDVDRFDALAQIKLFNLYNQIRDEGHAFLLVSGRAAPAQLKLRQDLVTRLGWGLVYQVHELSDEEKMLAMKRHAVSCGFELPQDICDYLLRHGRRDLPSLMRMLDALDRYSLVNQRQITIPLLRELMQGTS